MKVFSSKIAFLLLIGLISTQSGFAQSNEELLKLLVKNNIIQQNQADSIRNISTPKESTVPVSFVVSKPIQVSGYTQVNYLFNQALTTIDGFGIRRARLDFKGAITSDWDYRLNLEFATAPKILDGYINYSLNSAFKVTAGQQKLPITLENQVADDKSESLDRSQVVEALVARGTDVIGNQLGRDIGLQVSGNVLNLFDYYAGVFNGSGFNVADKNKAKAGAGRVVVHIVKGIDFGGSYYNAFDVFGVPAKSRVRTRLGGELKITYSDFSLSSEYLTGKDDITDKAGYYALLAYNLIPKKLQPIIKFDQYDSDKNIANAKTGEGQLLTALTLGVNYWFNDNAKIVVNYTIKKEELKEIRNDVLATQLQLSF